MTLSEFDQMAIIAFAESKMNIRATSRRIFISENGLRRHLIKVRINTGLDPFNFYDLAEIVRMIRNGEIADE